MSRRLARGLRRLASSATREDGFGLVETMMSLTLLAVVSAPLTGVLLAGIAQQKSSHDITLAGQAAQTAIESIRALPYDSVGTPNGNPTGTVPPTEAASALGVSLDATIRTTVNYVDDAPSTSYRTRADYKRVVVTVVRNRDQAQLAQDSTFVAPPGAGAYAGSTAGIIIAQVVDYILNAPVQNATVTVAAGPSPTRNDLTDATGTAVFPALLPTTTPQPYYTIQASGTGYVELKDDLPPTTAAQTALAAGQTFNTVLRVYKPATLYLFVRNADGSPYLGTATATIQSPRGTQTVSFTGGSYTATALNGEPLVPNLQYTVHVLTSDGRYAVSGAQVVPNAYPTDLTSTMALTLNTTTATMQTLTVKTVGSTGAAIANAAVTVSGGPGSGILLTGTTNASGLVTFTVPAGSSTYTTAATSGALSGTGTTAVGSSPVTKTVTLK